MAKTPKIAADAGMSLSDRVQYQKRLAELEAATKARIAAEKRGQAVAGGFIDKLNYGIDQSALGRGLTFLGSATAQGVQQGANNVSTGVSMLAYSDGNPAMIISGIEQIAQGALTMGVGWNKAASSLLSAVPAPIRATVANYINTVVKKGNSGPVPSSVIRDIQTKAKPLSKKEAANLQAKANVAPTKPQITKTTKTPDDIAKTIDDTTARNNQFYDETLEEARERLANDIYQAERQAENVAFFNRADEVVDEFGNLKQPASTANYFDDIADIQTPTTPIGVVDDVARNTKWADEYSNARAQGKSSAEARLISNTVTGLRKSVDEVNPTLANAGRKLDDAPELRAKPTPDAPGKPGIIDRLKQKPPILKKPDFDPYIPAGFGFPNTETFVQPFIPPFRPDGSGTSPKPTQERNTLQTPKKPKFFTPAPVPGTGGTPGTPGTGGTIPGGSTVPGSSIVGAASGTGGTTGTSGSGPGSPAFVAAAAAQVAASQAANAARARALSNQARDKYATGVMRALSRAGDVFAGRSQARLGQQLTGVGRAFQQDVAANKQEGIVDQDTLTKAYIESLSSGYGGQAQDALRRYKSRAAEAQKISRIG